MSRYTATISHSSIARAAVIEAGDTLETAMRRAMKEFGDGFVGHTILIMDSRLPAHDNVVASRRIGNRQISDLTTSGAIARDPSSRRTAIKIVPSVGISPT